MPQLTALISRFNQDLNAVLSDHELDVLKSRYLGKQGILSQALKQLADLPEAERRILGQRLNEIKQMVLDALSRHKHRLQSDAALQRLSSEKIDVGLPGRGSPLGSWHPITCVQRRFEQVLEQLGFDSAHGPEIETDYYNFEALNIPAQHPARAMHDTFYFSDGRVLRTHTSSVQIRFLEQVKPPVRIFASGRVYRRESDLTHTPMFNQIEGLVVEPNARFSDLKAVLTLCLSVFFAQPDLVLRFRPSYFPFTEPSAEVDIACVICSKLKLEQKALCRVCKATGWVEVLGCGMVHPNVLAEVNLDPKVYTGWAFGLGLERLAMLRYQIPDLRVFFDNDTRFLQNFKHI